MDIKPPVQPQEKKAQSVNTTMTNKRGHIFNRHMQSMVFSVYQFMVEELKNGGPVIPLSSVMKRVATALQISTTTVQKYVKIGKTKGIFDSPDKSRPETKKKRQTSENVKKEIRHITYDLYQRWAHMDICEHGEILGTDYAREEIVEHSVPTFAMEQLLKQPDDIKLPYNVGLDLHVNDLRTLLPGKYLNEQIINTYLKLIVARSGNSVYAADSSFYDQLMESYDSAQTWTKDDIFMKEMMFIPIKAIRHWTLCVVNFKRQTISSFDSLGEQNQSFIDTIRQYLELELFTKKHRQWDHDNWNIIYVQDAPRQDNVCDCGVFLCSYAEYLSRGAAFDFSAADITRIRYRMMVEILSSSLQPPTQNLPHKCCPKPIAAKKTLKVKKKQIKSPISKSIVESKTNIEGVILHQSATFHQGDKRFAVANTQCTAIATFAVVALATHRAKIKRSFLDDILIHGDKYYTECRAHNNVQELFLQPEELLKSINVFGKKVSIDIEECGGGDFSSAILINTLTNSIDTYINIYGYNIEEGGFLFVGHGKTVCFTVSMKSRTTYFMFNSHCVDANNCSLIGRRGKGVARLFRCTSIKSLARLLTTDHPRDSSFWQIYHVRILS